MSYNVEASNNNNRYWFIKNALPLGVLSTAAEIGIGACFLEEVQRDTFQSTLKNTAKEYAKDSQKDLTWLLKKIKWEQAAKYIEKLSPKKMFALAAGITAIGNAFLFQLIHNIFGKKSNNS